MVVHLQVAQQVQRPPLPFPNGAHRVLNFKPQCVLRAGMRRQLLPLLPCLLLQMIEQSALTVGGGLVSFRLRGIFPSVHQPSTDRHRRQGNGHRHRRIPRHGLGLGVVVVAPARV